MEQLKHWFDIGQTWAESHPGILFGLAAISLVMLVGSAALVPVVVSRLPVDEFLERKPPMHAWRQRHKVAAPCARILRNIAGFLCVLTGIAMIVLPGQGLLTIFVGLMLMEFPGKRRLILWVTGKRIVRKGLNWLRRRKGVAEFEF